KSYFCDPRGKIVAQASRDKDELLVAELNLDEIQKVRDTWQFYRDRRPESYGEITRTQAANTAGAGRGKLTGVCFARKPSRAVRSTTRTSIRSPANTAPGAPTITP